MTAPTGPESVADSVEGRTRAALDRFNSAFNAHDVDGVMAAMADDCLLEDTTPPDGGRHEGQEAVRRCWAEFFASSPGAFFDAEDVLVAGDRAVVRWRYQWSPDGGYVRGVDLFRVRDGRIAEKLSYVKG